MHRYPMMNGGRPHALVVPAAAGIAYAAASAAALALGSLPGNLTPVWWAAGVGTVALLFAGWSAWPGIALAAVLVGLVHGRAGIPATIVVAFADTLECAIAAALVARWLDRNRGLRRIQDVVRLAEALVIATVVSATISTLALVADGAVEHVPGSTAWRIAWSGRVAGMVLVVPIAISMKGLSIARPGRIDRTRPVRLLELALIGASAIASASIVFAGTTPHPYLTLPAIGWAAVRFGSRGAATAAAAVAVIGIVATRADHGPFAAAAAIDQMWPLDMFILVACLGAQAIAAVVAERDAATASLATTNRDLEHRIRAAREDLLAERAQLLEAQKLAQVGSWAWDVRTGQVRWSEELLRAHGHTHATRPDDYEGFVGAVHPDDRQRVEQEIRKSLRNGTPYSVEHRIVRPDGEVRMMVARGESEVDSDGRVVRMWGTGQDITDYRRAIDDREAAQARLSAQSESLRSYADHLAALHRAATHHGEDSTDSLTAYLHVGCDVLGLPTGTVSLVDGDTLRVLAVAPERPELPVGRTIALSRTLSDRVVETAATVVYQDTLEEPALDENASRISGVRSFAGAPVIVDGKVHATLAFSSFQPRAEPFSAWELALMEVMADGVGGLLRAADAERALKASAHHDALTALPNRALLIDRLRQALARSRRSDHLTALLFIDLDHFKLVNDSFGHAAGDQLLIEVAHRLRAAAREGDTVARLGGDEFVVLAEGLADREQALSIAARINTALAAPVVLQPGQVTVAASVGIAFDAGGDATSLLRDADTALYEAKEQGRNRFQIFDDTLRVRTVRRLEDEQVLRAALDENAFVVHYQPVIDLGTGRVQSAEALLRVPEPDGSVTSPDRFIEIAEATGLIVELGAAVLDRACAQLAAWRAELGADAPRTIAVNVSGKQLAAPGFDDVVLRCLETHGLPGEALSFELTESTLIGADDSTMEAIARLHERGVSLAIDDFGTGYSSLAYLHRFPVGAVKLDRSFVAALGAGQPGAEIVRAVIALSRALGISVVAEGVERPDQLQILLDLGCPAAQGYLFSPPLPPDETAAWLTKASVVPA